MGLPLPHPRPRRRSVRHVRDGHRADRQRLKPRYFAASVAAAFALTLLGGGAIGLYLLLAPLAGIAVDGRAALVSAHGQLQLVGFATVIVAAVGLELIPRSRGARPFGPYAAAVPAALVIGTLVRTIGIPQPMAAPLGAAIVTAASAAYAYLALRAIATGVNARRGDDAALAGAAVWLPVGAGLDLAAALDTAGGAPLHAAAIAALLYGSVGGHILAFSTRLAPGFAALAVPSARRVAAAGALWNLGVLLIAASFSLGWVLAGSAWVVAATAIRIWSRRPILNEAPLHAIVARAAFRAGFGWAIATAVIALFWGEGAARHAFAFGVILSVLFGVGARLIPGLAGGRAVAAGTVALALALVSLGAAGRVLAEGGVIPYAPTAALSGVAVYVAMAAFAVGVVRAARPSDR